MHLRRCLSLLKSSSVGQSTDRATFSKVKAMPGRRHTRHSSAPDCSSEESVPLLVHNIPRCLRHGRSGRRRWGWRLSPVLHLKLFEKVLIARPALEDEDRVPAPLDVSSQQANLVPVALELPGLFRKEPIVQALERSPYKAPLSLHNMAFLGWHSSGEHTKTRARPGSRRHARRPS